MNPLQVEEPLAAPRYAVGHAGTQLVDHTRNGRELLVDVWYPAAEPSAAASTYDLFAGVSFSAHATELAVPMSEPLPVVLWSHGRTGTRTSYVLLCEGLAAQGYVVVAPDHPGDTLGDWLAGTASDDTTNESDRVDDIGMLLDHVTSEHFATVVDGLHLDAGRVVVVGHSYGGWTAIAAAAAHGSALKGASGLQPFSRTIPRSTLAEITLPVLLVAGSADTTTPPPADAHRAFDALGSDERHLVEIEAAGHQACSDVGLYLEMLPQVEGLPDLVHEMVGAMAPDVTGTAGDPWRPVVSLHLEVLSVWLEATLASTEGVDSPNHTYASRSLKPFAARPGVAVRSRNDGSASR